ncbi:MAG: CvpA family protein [Cyclobacteriaceae bacterium]|nr:CvpA family protein [Cyclobacteriaceae bacterium]
MSKIDIALGFILALGAFFGYRRGFLMELFFLVAIVLGIFLGFKLMSIGMEFLQREFNADKKFLPYISFLIVFILVLVLTLFFGRRIKNSLDNTFLGKVDAIAGALLGVVKYIFCLSVIFWLGDSLHISLPADWTKGSVLYPATANAAQKMSSYLSQFVPFFKEIFRQF